MSEKSTALAIVLLFAGLIVGGGIGYFSAPSATKIVYVTSNHNLPVSPQYVDSLPSDLSKTFQSTVGDYVIYVWSVEYVNGDHAIYWTYAKVGG